MKRALSIVLILFLSILPIFAIKTETTKKLTLQGGYSEVLNLNVSTITSQGVSDLVGMPFDIFDPYSQYNRAADNPAYGERVIAKWSILSNCNYALSIEATPLKHVDQEQERLLYYRLAHEFSLSYTNTSGELSQINGFYVFEPDETATDGSGKTSAFINGAYKFDSNGNGKIDFTEITSDYWALDGTFIGAVESNIYFGFTESTSEYLMADTWDDTSLPDGIYEATVTINVEVI